MSDDKNYAWLDTVGQLPRMVAEARKLLGTEELSGDLNSKPIMGWSKEVGDDLGDAYLADSVPWCGLFMTVVARRAGKTPPKKPLWALNWKTFGQDGGQPDLGDTLVFWRKTPEGAVAGHVGLYIGEDASHYHVLGGNQNNAVCFARKPKERLVVTRQPLYMQEPESVRPRYLNKDGTPFDGTPEDWKATAGGGGGSDH